MCMWLPEQLILCRVCFYHSGNCDFLLEIKIMPSCISFSLCGYSADTPHLASVVAGKNNFTPLVQCTSHMCPVRVHWHVKLNYKEYWRVKVTITNFNYRMNYSEWNLVVQHPNFDNLTELFSFNYKSLTPYGDISKYDPNLIVSRTCYL